MLDNRPLISIVTPCFNEAENVELLHESIRTEFENLPKYRFQHLFIDNASRDNTVEVLERLATKYSEIGVIVNSRNFGHIRSPFHALKVSEGAATILLAADFQDPPELLPLLIKKWEEGFSKVLLVKKQSDEKRMLFWIRKTYYRIVNKLSEVDLIENATGAGLFDQKIIELLRKVEDPYPYFRGLIQEIGFDTAQVVFRQPVRKRGFSKNNFYTLYDIAMLGITNHSKVPLRIAAFSGFILSILSGSMGVIYLFMKLMFWDKFAAGTTPILIVVSFASSVQLFFLGILGEYVGSIQTHILNRPLVVEKSRFGFLKT